MGDKKTRRGPDTLRGDIQELTEVIADLRDKIATQRTLISAEHFAGGRPASLVVSDVTRELEAHVRSSNESGSISAYGYFQNSGENETPQVYRWSMEEDSIQGILNGPITQYAHMLAAIGHPQRLNILLMLLAEPATANDVVSQLSLGTTGAAYHHLNVLQAAGFVEQEHRGTFTIVAHRIPAFLTILASLSNGMAVEILDHIPGDTDPDPEDDDMGTVSGTFPQTTNNDEAISGPAA